MKLEPYLSPYTKLKIDQNLNLGAKTIKTLRKRYGGNLPDIGFGSDFLDLTPKAQATKVKIDKSDFIKI